MGASGENVAESADVLTAGQSKEVRVGNRRKELDFRIAHGLLLGFFTLLILLHGLGIYLFTSGFLLTRLVLENQSQCSIPPIALHGAYEAGSPVSGCWHPKTFDKAVILIIDALRYDFTIPFEISSDISTPRHYHNALPILHETALKEPNNAFLRPFIADPPTTTLQRLKALMTGTLPTFIEGGSNFAADSIEEDTLISQLSSAGKTIVQLGDDTWQKLFPQHFDPELTRPYDSFDVPDLHTVDDGVISHLMPLLHPSNTSRWDVIIGHGLGVDHVGHNVGPDHPKMLAKLRQMNDMITQAMSLIDDNTLLVVMGDHGMDSKGNHGGESDDEVEAALWMYSKQKSFGRSSTEFTKPPSTAKDRPVSQVDLVPTLALLLGLPIPFNNLGTPIEEAFIGVQGTDWQNLAYVNRLTAAQVHRFRQAYALVREPDPDVVALPDILWHAASNDWEKHAEGKTGLSADRWSALAGAFSSYQTQNIAMFRFLWARFDAISMSMGVAVLVLTIAIMILYAQGITGDITDLHFTLFSRGIIALLGGGISGYLLAIPVPDLASLKAAAFSASISCCSTLLFSLLRLKRKVWVSLPNNIWSWTCLTFVILLAGGFGSNSYTVWEEESLLFMLASLGTMMLAAASALKTSRDRNFASTHAVIFMAMLRVASFARVCREEQLPDCTPLFYASSSTTTSAGWQLTIPYFVAVALPSLIQAYYNRTASWQGSAPMWIGIGFRAALFAIGAVWTLYGVDEPLLGLSVDTLKTVRIALAQVVLMTAVGAGGATFGWMPPLLGIQRISTPALKSSNDSTLPSKSNGEPQSSASSKQQLVVSGTTNLYGSHFSTLPFTVLMVPLLLLSQPMGQLSLFCISIAMLSLLELLALLRPQSSPPTGSGGLNSSMSSLGPVILALLGHFAYFKTGHQAALASIQWDSAFIPLRTNRLPWSAIFVIFNTFAGQILSAAAVPAIVLWRRPFNFTSSLIPFSDAVVKPDAEDAARHRRELLTDLAKAQVTHFLVYSVINLATTVFSAHLRRHLMLYRVFCPRWMLGSVSMIIAELAGTFIGIGGTAWTVGSLSILFGW